MESLKILSVDELHDFLAEKLISSDVLASMENNGVTGAVFLELTDDDLKEMAPRMADRVALRRIQRSQSDEDKPQTPMVLEITYI